MGSYFEDDRLLVSSLNKPVDIRCYTEKNLYQKNKVLVLRILGKIESVTIGDRSIYLNKNNVEEFFPDETCDIKEIISKYLNKAPAKEEDLTVPNAPLFNIISHNVVPNEGHAFENIKLSQNDTLTLYGTLSSSHISDLSKSPQYAKGSENFRLIKAAEVKVKLDKDPNNAALLRAYQYALQVERLQLPILAGISGTLDQSTAMAGLVGIGLDKKQELKDIRLAFLGFMVDSRDHSVHEILQSSRSYGMAYTPGPGFEKDIYNSLFANQVKNYLKGTLKSKMPDKCLSKEFVKELQMKVMHEQNAFED